MPIAIGRACRLLGGCVAAGELIRSDSVAIYLDYKSVFQGAFELKARNLLFVFQVNCPGCFIYGIPLANSLFQKYGHRGMNVMGLSTAFEDFEYNTADHTLMLLSEKKTVGATKKALGENYLQSIDFPVALDRRVTGAELATPANIEFFMQRLNGVHDLGSAQRKDLQKKVHEHFLATSQTSATFFMNELPGTPTFLLVDQQLELLAGWFGHRDEAEVDALVAKHLAV